MKEESDSLGKIGISLEEFKMNCEGFNFDKTFNFEEAMDFS